MPTLKSARQRNTQRFASCTLPYNVVDMGLFTSGQTGVERIRFITRPALLGAVNEALVNPCLHCSINQFARLICRPLPDQTQRRCKEI
jgi:hypothetical protein